MVREKFQLSGYLHSESIVDADENVWASGTTSEDIKVFMGISTDNDGVIDGGYTELSQTGFKVGPGLILDPQSSAPTNTTLGMLYYLENGGTSGLYVRGGAGWEAIAGGGGGGSSDHDDLTNVTQFQHWSQAQVDASIDSKIGTFTRYLSPDFINPYNAYTVGVSNVAYWSLGPVAFGPTSKTTGAKFLLAYFTLPDDYVDDSNIILSLKIKLAAGGANPDVIDYYIDMWRIIDGSANVLEDNQTSTWSNDYSSSKSNTEIATFDGTNVNAGEGIKMVIYMEDDSNNLYLHLMGIKLKIQVSGKD